MGDENVEKYGIVILDIKIKEAIGPFEYCETVRALIDLKTLQETPWGLTLRIGLKEIVRPRYFVTREGDNVNLCTMEPGEVG